MKKNLFSKDELKKIRDVASLLTVVNRVENSDFLTDCAYNLWRVFENYNGDSIYD